MNKTKPDGKLLEKLIDKNVKYDNWQIPADSKLEKEYNVEYKNHILHMFGDVWPTLEDFSNAIKNGKVLTLNKLIDATISNRSHTSNMADLVDLVSSYKSWPEFRNMDTLKDMITRFKENQPLTMPIVLSEPGNMFLMSGNTKLDIAFMMNINPQVIVIEI